MELPNDDIVKQSYLKFRGKGLGIWTKKWAVMKKPSSRGGSRLEFYNDEKSSSNRNKCEKIIELSDLIEIQGVTSDIKKHAFSLIFKDKSAKSFCCDSDHHANRWMQAIEALCLHQPVQTVHNVDLLQSGPSQKEFTELFHVYLVQSPNLPIYGECLLQVTDENIYVLDNNNPAKRLVAWPLNALRRYGSDYTKFTFESGRYCETGEGIFIFNTTDSEAIYQKVHSATVAIAEMHRLVTKNDLVMRGMSVPVMSPSSHHVLAARSRSTPSYPGGEAPEPPPRPATMPSTPVSKLPGSAVNYPLPPVSHGVMSMYLSNPEDDVGGPPLEQAPEPPRQMNMPTHMRGATGPDMYLNMMAKAQGVEDEYYGHSSSPFNQPPAGGASATPTSNDPGYIKYHDQDQDPYREVRGNLAMLSLARSRDPTGDVNYINQVGQSAEASGAGEEGSRQEDDYIYEEKALSCEFRKYLKGRKVDD